MQLLRAKKERIKTLFIVLLGISAVILGLGTGLFETPLRAGGSGAAQEETRLWDRERQIRPAARPTAAMLSLGEGEFQGHLLGAPDVFDRFSGYVGEALGSSGLSEPVTRAMWEAALSDTGVFFRYDVDLSGETFAQWLGTEIGGATKGQMQQLFLSVRADAVYLYYMGHNGISYRSTTAVRPEELRDALAATEPNGARFGFLDPAYTGPEPDTVLLADYSGFPVIRGENAVSGVYIQERAFLEGLGLNPALVRSLDEGGTRTIVEGGATVVIRESGLITYHCQSENPRLTVGSTGALDLARQIAQVLHLTSGEAEVYLTNWTYTSGHPDGRIVYQFRYFIDGVPIWTEYPAATVVVTGRTVAEVTLLARAFHRTGQTAPVMPEIQAAAASGGVSLRLTFAETGETTELRARWLLAEGNHG